METIITPTKITKENFSEFGEVISAEKVNPIDINDGFAKRYDNLADINTLKDKGKTIVSIFSSVKRSFPMKIDMMEKHPLGSQAFMPMKETTFLCFVAPQGDLPKISKIKSFIIPPRIGINYKPGIWHFPLISTEDTDFLVIDRQGSGENLIIHKFEKENVFLKF
jgi:ureidoglycolate lyase|tara:strand:+ start:412 stop:906 length:495 start_codon:yes stop_codon:yes gene_type:complete